MTSYMGVVFQGSDGRHSHFVTSTTVTRLPALCSSHAEQGSVLAFYGPLETYHWLIKSFTQVFYLVLIF